MSPDLVISNSRIRAPELGLSSIGIRCLDGDLRRVIVLDRQGGGIHRVPSVEGSAIYSQSRGFIPFVPSRPRSGEIVTAASDCPGGNVTTTEPGEVVTVDCGPAEFDADVEVRRRWGRPSENEFTRR